MGYYENFVDDIDIALTDIAGISTSNVTKYISGPRLLAVKSDKFQNAFTKDIIEVGNAPNDKTQYWDYFDLSRIDPMLKSRPMYLHLDMSLAGDKTGLAGTWIIGKKPPREGEPQSKELFYRVPFAVSIKAPKGYQISFEKHRQFIYWLKEQGFNIKGISSDTFQNADLAQTLISKGYDYKVISVDRVNSDRICEPYQYLKSTIYEERIELPESDLMTEEFLGLERNSNGKIDHPNGGQSGSKDLADAICGSVWNASQNAEQYAFDFGETLDTIVNVGKTNSYADVKEQLQVDIQEQMIQLLDPMVKNTTQPNNSNPTENKEIVEKPERKFKPIDFGMGPAQVYKPAYLNQGIIYW